MLHWLYLPYFRVVIHVGRAEGCMCVQWASRLSGWVVNSRLWTSVYTSRLFWVGDKVFVVSDSNVLGNMKSFEWSFSVNTESQVMRSGAHMFRDASVGHDTKLSENCFIIGVTSSASWPISLKMLCVQSCKWQPETWTQYQKGNCWAGQWGHKLAQEEWGRMPKSHGLETTSPARTQLCTWWADVFS